ncbi:NTE family protein [Desulfonispora thiosulfatigenes DSM 11270]|uniref:NTE family protein n=1 Tax=Desulfonispora thiosulfatigenes DSM 11270 TaxID=656914 RepID=A0A1W1VT05_DESTI|nr:patatin-like phospholipase family protein [Desulfonispora thiosulfatigenes]SMB96497.1 NTE family protein [Desulfonispora thiosulfatigenes DSM 11270]
MRYKYRNLIFEGGGIKCLAYAGAIDILEEKNILKNIKRVGGTSGGAILALLFGLNYSVNEIKNILNNLDFTLFLDKSSAIATNAQMFYQKFGWYRGEVFYNWISEIIKYKTKNEKISFKEIYINKRKYNFRDIYIIGTNLSTGYSEVFSYEHTPNMALADAVRISMSIPLVYIAPKMNGDIYIDGGVLNNYPIKLFDRIKYIDKYYRIPDYYRNYNNLNRNNKGEKYDIYVYNIETLGFRVESEKEIALFNEGYKPESKCINNLPDFIYKLIQTIMDNQANEHLHSDDKRRTVYIDSVGVGCLSFNISDEIKSNLILSGKRCTQEFFNCMEKCKKV